MSEYYDIVYPTTDENRFKSGSVNIPVKYHDMLVNCHISYRTLEQSVKDMKEKLRTPLTFKQRLTGKI